MPQQQVLYLGVVLDAGRLRTTLSESRQASLLQAVCRLRQGATVTALTVMQTLGLMAAAHVVVPLGLLHMRRLQRWFSSLRLDPKRHKVEGNPRFWGSPDHLRRWSPLGPVTSYITVFTDASGTGWGGTCLGRAIVWRWSLTETRHSNLVELRAVVLVLQHFKPLIQGRHVIVRNDNSTTVAYINRQGGVRSAALLTTAEKLWLWASEVVLSLRALHIPGLENRGATSCRGADPCQASGRFTRSTRAMAKEAALRLSTVLSHSPTPGESEARTSVNHPSFGGRCLRRQVQSGRYPLWATPLSDSVIQSIQAARAGSTTACYRPKWLGFLRWCEERKIEPLSCELGSILSYLQLLVDRGLAHSTVKVYMGS